MIEANAERWACSFCNHDICDACEPAAAEAADAAADAEREAACKKLSAAVAAAAVASVVAAARATEQTRWHAVRVRLSDSCWLRASRDWGEGTLLLETKPPSAGYKDKYMDERQRHGQALQRAAEAEARATDATETALAQKRTLEKAESLIESLELQLAAAGPSHERELRHVQPAALLQAHVEENKRRRRHAETTAAASGKAAAKAKEATAAAKADAKQAIAAVKEREGRRVLAAEQMAASEKRERQAAEARAEAAEAKAAKMAKTAESATAAQAKAEGKVTAAAAKAASAVQSAEAKVAGTLERAKARAEASAHEAELANERARRADERTAELKRQLGLDSNRWLPGTDDRKRGLPLLKSVIDGRSAADVAAALKGAGGTPFLTELVTCPEFQPMIKKTIEETAAKIQERWSPRLAVLIMSDLQLSREQFQALRHYLSFAYDVGDDVYNKLLLYVNPHNKRDAVAFPSLAPRNQWEPERNALFGLCGVESSADGMVSYVKDQRGAMAQMVAEHWAGISSDVKAGKRKLLIAGFGDATGGWRGSSITHFELGIASWENTEVKQCSKSNLLPAALAEGDDGAENLRLRFQSVADGFDDLASGKPLQVDLPSGRLEVPIDFTFSGDFQIHKAVLGMSKYTSAIWCECTHETTGMFNFRAVPATTWAEVLAWYDTIGCVVKTLEKVCELNHYSYEVLQGKPFKRFKCTQPGCAYEAKSEQEWRTDVAAFDNLKAYARKEITLIHGRGHKRHRPFMRPMLARTPPLRMSVDTLHILFINMFVTYVEATLLVYIVEFDEIGRQPVQAFLASKKIPMKIVKAQDVGEMKDSLIGRDAKVFMENAQEIIPELLCLVHLPKADVQEAAAAAANVDSDDFTWGGEDGDADPEPTLEARVAAKWPGASVTRVAAAAASGALLGMCAALTAKNMRQFCDANELSEMRDEMAAASIIAIEKDSKLLAFCAYLANEKEGEHVVTYLLQLQRDLSDTRSKGLGSELEAEICELALASNESIMLTVMEANSARGFYGKRGYWIDASSPQNHATASTRPRRPHYLIMRKYPDEGESVHERDARFWDNFYTLTRSFRVFESDTDSYRQQRAVEVFNGASQVGRDVKILRPTLQSACPHIVANIIPRQIVEMGDPLKRGCDQSEGFGANLKSTIHRRVSRNKITGKDVKHTRRDASGAVTKQWTQKALKVSRVMQAFRTECVCNRIVRDPGSAKYLLRKHHRLLGKGRASGAPVKEERPDERNIAEAYVRRVRELRNEGGEPA